MSKLMQLRDNGWLLFHCPGCKCDHWLNPATHKVTEDWNTPTVTPRWSMLWNEWGTSEKGAMKKLYQGRCHILILEGQLQYQHDCTHSLRGKTIDMVDFESLDGV